MKRNESASVLGEHVYYTSEHYPSRRIEEVGGAAATLEEKPENRDLSRLAFPGILAKDGFCPGVPQKHTLLST